MRTLRTIVKGLVLAGVCLGLADMAAAQSPSKISILLDNRLSTENAQAGDTFTGTLAEPLVRDGRVVAQKEARVRGRVGEVVSSGRLKRPALITLSLDSVQSSSRSYPIEAADLTIKADSHTTRNVVIIGGSVGAGALIGGAAAGGKGAAIGALAGAGAGTLAAFLTGKREIVLPPETVLTFEGASVNISSRELARLPRAGQRASTYQQDADADDERDTDSNSMRRRSRRADEDSADESGERVREGASEWDPVFTRRERTLIANWFGTNRSSLPPGLAKRDRLPPGLEKQLRERGTLPPGLQKRMQPLPYDLERQLRRLPRGYRRVIVGGSVILMEERSALIYDIIRNVIS